MKFDCTIESLWWKSERKMVRTSCVAHFFEVDCQHRQRDAPVCQIQEKTISPIFVCCEWRAWQGKRYIRCCFCCCFRVVVRVISLHIFWNRISVLFDGLHGRKNVTVGCRREATSNPVYIPGGKCCCGWWLKNFYTVWGYSGSTFKSNKCIGITIRCVPK